MATVYLARDVRHQRSVALKVLNPELGAVLGKERFLAEIQVTANLQHPNLLPLFDSGEAEGLLFYVMPFVEGESLRARLDREKQLPVDEAIRLAVAVAGALEYAHARGVIHRDLKPENILLQAGQPMIADFGIALAVSRAGGARITQTGLSLGTPQYMSPEQAAGDRVVDGRTDIYSLGAVTYEMLAGEPPHTGPTAQAIIAKLMTDEARPLPSLRRSVPTQIDVAVRHALEKLPADRFSTAGEFAESLQSRAAPSSSASFNAAESRAVAMATPGRMASVLQSRLWPAAFVITALAAVAATWAWVAARREQPGMTVRFPLTAGPNSFVLTSQSTAATTLAFAPDGRTIAFVNVAGNSRQLFLRTLNDVRTRAVAGTEGGEQPFFSPDGKWLGFVLGRQLMKVPVEGGSATRIADLTGTVYGVSWAPNDRIVVSTNNLLAVVPAAGGTARAFAPPDTSTREIAQWWPRALPDGRTVAYTSWRGSVATSRIALASLESGKVTDLHLSGTAISDSSTDGWLT